MDSESPTLAQRARRDWAVIAAWIAGISAVLGFLGTVTGTFSSIREHFRQHSEYDAQMTLAHTQLSQGEYKAAVDTYGDILKADPLNRAAQDAQVNAAEQWAENFTVPVNEGQDPGPVAAPLLDEIFAVLDAGLARAKGTQAADVQAHVGWTHWLNQHIGEREFGNAAQQNLQAALAADPNNVYANAMLGNILLQTDGDFHQAVQHLNTAVATGKARPFVRDLQIAGLLHLDEPGARAELVRAVNDMRKNNEPLDDDTKARIGGWCFDPGVTNRAELAEALGAVPPDEAWQTYLWLDASRGSEDASAGRHRAMVHDFIQANLLEVSGKPQDALARYRALQTQLKGQGSTMQSAVDEAVKRLTH